MKHALLIALSLLSSPAFAADPIKEVFDGHIQLLTDAGNKRDTLLAQERFAQFRSLFCGTMKNPQEAEYCISGMNEGVGTLIEQMSEMMDSPPEDEAAQEQPWQNAGTLADNGELVGDGLLSASSTCADQAVIDEALRVGNANIKPERANGLKITRMEKPESIPDMVQEGVKYCRMTAVFNNGMTDGALVGIATPKGGKTQIVVLPNDGGY